MAVQLSEDVVFKWLDSHQDSAANYVEKWLQTRPSTSKRLCSMQHNTSSPMFQPLVGQLEETKLLNHRLTSPPLPISNRKRKSNAELRQLNRQELFMELLTDVVSPNFDVNHLSHKILANVLVLINGDRSSLFLVEGTEENPVLVSRLFDVMEHTSVEDAIHEDNEALKIPFGKGIIGFAAQNGVAINLENAYKDSRFNSDVDGATGYKTKSILCMPIKTSDGHVIGVAEVINKMGEEDVFSKQDEMDFQTYLTFCAIGLVNAQLLDQSFSLSRRLQVLLQLTQGLFEDTTCLEVVMEKVMQQSLELIPSESCTVLLIDEDNEEEEVKFHRAFQVHHRSLMTQSLTSVKSCDMKCVTDIKIATEVAMTGKPYITTPKRLEGISQSTSSPPDQVDENTSSLLCLPIFSKDRQTIGIAKLVNKLSGLPFNQLDKDTFGVFTTFCGLGLHNVFMYEKISKAHARHKVAVEVLSYHASASPQEADKLMSIAVPEADQYLLLSYSFDDLSLTEEQTVLASIRMFMDSGLLQNFRINTKTLYRWMLTVKKNYRPVTYHNWRHAFNVAQTMFTMFQSDDLSTELTNCEKLALLVACFCHDLDHRGTNNEFQTKSESPLAKLYTTSTMEHHHLDHCTMILNSEGNQIFSSLNSKEFDEVMGVLGNAILSTDLKFYFKRKGDFQNVVENHLFSWSDTAHRDLLRSMLITACDVAAITKPWPIQVRVAEMVANEFFEQGDVEREQLNSEPDAMMDRRKKKELPSMQVGFIQFVCMPLYEKLAQFSDQLRPLLNGVINNKNNWQHLADNPNDNWDDPVLLSPSDCVIIHVKPLTGGDEEQLQSAEVQVSIPNTPEREGVAAVRFPSSPLIEEGCRSPSNITQPTSCIHMQNNTQTEVIASKRRKREKCSLC